MINHISKYLLQILTSKYIENAWRFKQTLFWINLSPWAYFIYHRYFICTCNLSVIEEIHLPTHLPKFLFAVAYTREKQESTWLQRDSDYNHLVHKLTLNHLSKLTFLGTCEVFVCELRGCGFDSLCSHLNFRHHGCFDQGVPCYLGNCRL